jgi:hypothetical protein
MANCPYCLAGPAPQPVIDLNQCSFGVHRALISWRERAQMAKKPIITNSITAQKGAGRQDRVTLTESEWMEAWTAYVDELIRSMSAASSITVSRASFIAKGHELYRDTQFELDSVHVAFKRGGAAEAIRVLDMLILERAGLTP